MTKRHLCHRRGNVEDFDDGALGSFLDEPRPSEGGIVFGYVQRKSSERGTADFYWVSVDDVVFEKAVPFAEGRHMGHHSDGKRKGEPRGFFEATAFDDGGATTILLDAIVAHGGETELGGLLLDALVGLAALAPPPLDRKPRATTASYTRRHRAAPADEPEEVVREGGRAGSTPRTRTKRAEFTDRQKAEIFVRDRALCCFSGKSLWLLDYGVGAGSIDWVDHIQPASKGGAAELTNGACASWVYNSVKGDSREGIYLFWEGRPRMDFFTHHQEITPSIAAHLSRFSRLHVSDWYFNRAVFHILLAAATHGELRGDGRPFIRGLDYRAKCAAKNLKEWTKSVAKAGTADMASRGLVLQETSHDQRLLLELATIKDDLEHLKAIAVELAPLSAASWTALADQAEVSDRSSAAELVARVSADPCVVPRVKALVRENMQRLYFSA